MKFDDETLMAYADGELDASVAAQVERAMQDDPDLARRVEDFRRVAAVVRSSQGAVLAEAVPLRLLAAAIGRPPGRARFAPMFAMAASLLLGVALTWVVLRQQPALTIQSSGQGLIAGGALDRALTEDLSSVAGEESVHVGLSFRDGAGEYCRTFQLDAVAGLACRADMRWHIVVTASDTFNKNTYRMAGVPLTIQRAIEERIVGAPLDATEERIARDHGWQTPAP